MPALYTSLRFETAWLEAQQAFPFKAQPMTLCAYEVDCEDVLDLTDAAILAANGINPADLACPWKDLVYTRDQAAILGDHGASRRSRDGRCHRPQLRQRCSRGGCERRVLGLGAGPAAPGPGGR